MSLAQIVYVDMDDVLTNYTMYFRQKLREIPTQPYPQSQYGFFADIPAIDGAIESVKTLIADENIEPYILTAPSIRNPMCYAEKRIWVEKHFGLEFTERLIISRNKSLLRGDVLIDDQLGGRGQELFIGQKIHFGSNEYPDWNSVMKKLNELNQSGQEQE
jgi:5'(3')-deoxyribonucleotidase